MTAMKFHHRIVQRLAQVLKSISGLLWITASFFHRLGRRHRAVVPGGSLLVVGSTRSGGSCKTDLVAWIAHRHSHLAILVHPTGDENVFLETAFPSRVFVHQDFHQAWKMARTSGFAAALCDGGLQDPALEDCAALCLEIAGPAPTLADLHPFGPFRELRPRPRREIRRLIVEGDLCPQLDRDRLPPPGSNVLAACSIARPEVFFADLRSVGLNLVEAVAFGDHRPFLQHRLGKTMDHNQGLPWIVTTKDAARGELGKLPNSAWVAKRVLAPPPVVVEQIDQMVRHLGSTGKEAN